MSVVIGGRYTRQHIVRRDSASGTFEEVNSPLHTTNEQVTQLAVLGLLLAEKGLDKFNAWVPSAMLTLALFAAVVAMLKFMAGGAS